MDGREDEGRWLALVQAERTEAEWSVVGSMLIDARTVPRVMGRLCAEDFADPTCRNTFEGVRALFLAGRPVDPVTVGAQLGGGPEWVSWCRQVLELTPTAANVMEYAGIVREKAMRRRVRDAAAALAEAAPKAESEALTRMAMALPALISGAGRGRTVTAAEMMEDAWQRVTGKRAREFLPWGVPSMDKALFTEPGDLVLLGGYPSAGKTLLSVQLAIAQARSYRVVYYTLETQPDKMGDRILAHISPASLTAIKKAQLSAEGLGRVAEASAKYVSETPITFVHASHFTVDDIAADALAKRAQVVYIDYVQLVDGEGHNDYARVSRVSRELKMFAQSNRVTVVALAQLARSDKIVQKGQVKKLPPDMSSLKESGQLEQDADAVLLLWRLNDEDNGSPRVLKLGKNKEGRKFSTVLSFDGATQTMTDLEVSPRDYGKDGSIAAELSANGRAIKKSNRAKAQMDQMGFRELGDDDPFGKEDK